VPHRTAADECVHVHGFKTVDTDAMPAPLESNFLVPNGTLVVLAMLTILALLVVGLLVGSVVWLLTSRRGANTDR
jgi:hypothetical protein